MKARMITAILLSLLTTDILWADASSRFKVDTRDDKLKIRSFNSNYCSGRYGSRDGKRAYFPANFMWDLDVVFSVEADEGIVGFIYSDMQMTTTEKTHRVSLRGKPAGYSLTVIGVDRDGRQTEPFRANFDMVGICFAPILKTTSQDNGVLTYSGSAEFSGREIGGVPTVALPGVDNSSANAKMGLVPKLELAYEFNSDGTAELTAGSITSRHGTMQRRKSNGRWGRCFGFEFDWECSGSVFLQYSGSGLSPVGGKLTGSVDGNISKRLRWPAFPLLYAEGKFGGRGEIFLSYDGRKYVPNDWMSAFNIGTDCVVPYGTLGVGAGLDGVADVNISGTAGFGFRFNRELQDLYVPVDVEAYLELFWAKYSYNIFSGTYELYPNFGARVPRSGHSRSLGAVLANDFSYPEPRDLPPDAPAVADPQTLVAQNVVRVGSVHLTECDGVLQTVYLSRNDARSAMPDRPCLHFKAYTNEEVVRDEVVWDDGTGDFYPDLAVGTDGISYVAWVNGKAPLGEEASLGAVMTNAEIAVSVRNVDGTWTSVNLTQDDLYESAPSIAAADGTALVAWRRNDTAAMFGSASSPDQVWFSQYAAQDGWSEPACVFTSSGLLLGGDLAWNGTTGAYAYVQDADGDPETREDRDLYVVRFAEGAWGAAERVSDVSSEIRAPVAWYEGDLLKLVWQSGDRLLFKSGDAVAVEVCQMSAGAYDVALDHGMARAVVFTGTVDGQASSNAEVYAVAYDRDSGQWAQPLQVSKIDVRKDSVAGVACDDGRLSILYRAVGEDRNYADLNWLEVGFEPAVSIAENGISLLDDAVEPGSNLTVRVRVENSGLGAAADVQVSLAVVVDGSEQQVGTTNIASMVGGAKLDVDFAWEVVTSTSDIVFVARTGDSSVSCTAFKPDLHVGAVSCVAGIGEDYLRAKISNCGLVTVASGTRVEFRLGDSEGPLLGADSLGTVPYGADGAYVASVKWPKSIAATAAEQLVTVIVDPDEEVSEFNRDNNIRKAYVFSSLDTDGDGLTDVEELGLGTNVARRDTDDDGFTDYEEVMVYNTSPTVTTYTVKFDLGRYGAVAEGSSLEQLVDEGLSAKVPEFSVDKSHVFIGWDGELPEVITASLTLTAQYIPAPRNMTAISTHDPFSGAAEYLGWISDASGNMVGSLSVKVAKPGKGGMAKAKATVVRLETGKKTTLSDVLPTGAKAAVGTDALAGLQVTTTGINGKFASGEFAGHEVTAVLDQSKSKDPTVTAEFAAFKDKVFNLSMLSYGDGGSQSFARGYGTLSIVFAKSGKAKVSGFLPDGSKLSASVQLLLTQDGSCLPVIYSKSGKSRFAFALWFAKGARLVSEPLTNVSAWKTALVADDVAWQPNGLSAYVTPTSLSIRKFSAEAVDAETWFGQLIAFASGVPLTISPNLKKWDAGKAASLKLKDGKVTGADDPAKPNLTGLKLTFTPKNGTFKGSFSAVSLSESGSKPKLVKGKATVTGVLVDKAGYGTAVIKKTGSMPVTVK